MARPTVFYNGSGNNQYGGTNAPSTPVTGSNGDISGTTLTLNGTFNFTGVANDGTDVVYYQGNTGDRHLFRITAFNPSVASCTSLTLAETATAARTAKIWGVGGKRKTLENDTSRFDTTDMGDGWTFQFDDGTYTLTALHTIPSGTHANGRTTWKATNSRQATIRVATAIRHITPGNYCLIDGLVFDRTGTSSTTHCGIYGCGGGSILNNLGFGTEANNLENNILLNNAGGVVVRNCTIEGANNAGIDIDGRACFVLTGNTIRGNAVMGVDMSGWTTWYAGAVISWNFIHDNGDNIRVYMGGSGPSREAALAIHNNVIANATSDGIEMTGTFLDTDLRVISIRNNIIYGNGGYGIKSASNTRSAADIDFNAYGSNTSGDTDSNVTKGANSVTLTANPFVNPAMDNFNTNSVVNGGLSCQQSGWPADAGTSIGYTQYWAVSSAPVVINRRPRIHRNESRSISSKSLSVTVQVLPQPVVIQRRPRISRSDSRSIAGKNLSVTVQVLNQSIVVQRRPRISRSDARRTVRSPGSYAPAPIAGGGSVVLISRPRISR